MAEWQTRTFKGRVRKSVGSSPTTRTKQVKSAGEIAAKQTQADFFIQPLTPQKLVFLGTPPAHVATFPLERF